MKTVGFPISHKENEKRRAILPCHVLRCKHPEYLFIETGYGEVLGYSDSDYSQYGANITTHDTVLQQDVICDPKVGDADYLSSLHEQIIFGWIHAIQNRDITDKIIAGRLTAFAWEDMYEDGRHVFWRNNEIAGEAAVFHAYMCHGIFPYGTKAAVLGNGNVARGAIKTLNYMGAEVSQYNRKTENLFRKELDQFDVVVNGILWDTNRKDHILYHGDLKRMKKNALIIDVSCDRSGGIETSIPTTIDNPIYYEEGIAHYAVDHTPSLFWKTASASIAVEIAKYIDFFIEDCPNACTILNNSLIVNEGIVVDTRIKQFQNRL